MWFLYDESGNSVGFTLNGTEYYYIKNLQGDITAIADASGTIVAKYTYDVWGKILSVTDANGVDVSADSSHIANINPLRYRGYYYDSETGLYYVNSRYYDPYVARFISPDTTEILTATPTALTDKNLYAYCDNNPVVRADSNGEFWDYVIDGAFIVWSTVDAVREPTNWKNWLALGVDVVFAVVPFIPSGAGQVIKVGNKVDNSLDVANAISKIDNLQHVTNVTMIGRDMKRVTNTASLLGITNNLYTPWKGYDITSTGIKRLVHNSISVAHNGKWILEKLRRGHTVIDIGVSAAYSGWKSYGLWYGTERTILGLWQTRNLWKLPINYYK